MSNSPSFVFFGTSEFAVIILDELEKKGLLPSAVVTREDKPQGRHMTLTPPPVKVWAEARKILVLQPKKLDSEFSSQLSTLSYQLFIVASYGKIIPQHILELPTFQTLNVHPSLLPKLRGPAPIQGTILNEQEAGITIMRIDAEMDHGPILLQKKITIPGEWPPYADELEQILAHAGGELLAEVIPKWIGGTIQEVEQLHENATYVSMVKKSDAEIVMTDSAEINLRKVRAYSGWPKAFTIMHRAGKDIRVIITKATIIEGIFTPEYVIPEGRKEMSWNDFNNGFQNA